MNLHFRFPRKCQYAYLLFLPYLITKKILRWLAIFFLIWVRERGMVNTKRIGKASNSLGSRKHAMNTVIFCLLFWNWPQFDSTFYQPMQRSEHHICEAQHPLGRAQLFLVVKPASLSPVGPAHHFKPE